MSVPTDTVRDKRPHPKYLRIYESEYKHFAAVPKAVRPYAIAVYACIAHHADNKTDTAFPSYATICDETGLAKNTAIKAIRALVDSGHLSIKARYRKGERSSNLYTLLAVVHDMNNQDIVVHETNNVGQGANHPVHEATDVVRRANRNYTHEPDPVNQTKELEREPPVSLRSTSPKGGACAPSFNEIRMTTPPEEVSALLRAGLKGGK